jgi:hypothetical protein
MEIIGGDEFDRSARAAAAAPRLLDCCKALLGRVEGDVKDTRHPRSHHRRALALRAYMTCPLVAEAHALIARVEGRPPAANLLLGWSPGDLFFVDEAAARALRAAGVATVADLLRRTPPELIAAGLGVLPIRLIREGLLGLGLALARPAGPPPPAHPVYAASTSTILPAASHTPLASLFAAGIVTVADLVGRTAGDLLGLSGIGPRTIKALEEELRVYGLALAPSSAAGTVARAAGGGPAPGGRSGHHVLH